MINTEEISQKLLQQFKSNHQRSISEDSLCTKLFGMSEDIDAEEIQKIKDILTNNGIIITEEDNTSSIIVDDKELEEVRRGHENWDITRAKGLGELNAEDMEQSMLHPTERRLEVLTMKDAEAAAESIQMLMGPEVEERREFLFENVDFSILNN